MALYWHHEKLNWFTIRVHLPKLVLQMKNATKNTVCDDKLLNVYGIPQRNGTKLVTHIFLRTARSAQSGFAIISCRCAVLYESDAAGSVLVLIH